MSNVTIFALSLINQRTKEYANETDDTSSESTIAEDNNSTCNSSTYNSSSGGGGSEERIVTSELAKMMKHTTSAANSVWSAMDAVAKLVPPAPPSVKAIEAPKSTLDRLYRWTRWLHPILTILLFILYLFTLFTADSFLQACARTNALHRIVAKGDANLYALLHAQGEQLELNNLIFNRKLATIRTQTDMLADQAHTNDMRIDNIWEALGPPNANGTYYSTMGEGCSGSMMMSAEDIRAGSKLDVGKQLSEMGDRVDREFERRVKEMTRLVGASVAMLKKEMDDIKREWQLVDLRLSARLDRVERRGR